MSQKTCKRNSPVTANWKLCPIVPVKTERKLLWNQEQLLWPEPNNTRKSITPRNNSIMKIEEKPKHKEDSTFNPNIKSYSSSELEGTNNKLHFTENILFPGKLDFQIIVFTNYRLIPKKYIWFINFNFI